MWITSCDHERFSSRTSASFCVSEVVSPLSLPGDAEGYHIEPSLTFACHWRSSYVWIR
jgi:hypothetical protein